MPDSQNAGDHLTEPDAFHRELLSWGIENFRSFPWRFTRDPYRVLMAEIMLHRTQAAQVIPVYERFISTYPDVAALARASREEIISVLSPLGLRWRAELVHDMAAELQKRHGGIPYEKSELLSLPGVSDYIASAVRCFAWGAPEPVIDTNTVRVAGRLFGLKIKDSSRRNRLFRQRISELVDSERPREGNFALLDLAALICTSTKPPECLECPVHKHCQYGNDPSTTKRRDRSY